MDNIIAKKYAKAILAQQDPKTMIKELNIISLAFDDDNFLKILSSLELNNEQKIDFLLSFIKKPNSKLVNLLKLLAQNSRLNLIPKILNQINKTQALKDNVHFGVIYSKIALEENQIINFEQKLSKKFQTKIKLNNQIKNIDGIKITLDELGYELSFCVDSLRVKMTDYILKTI